MKIKIYTIDVKLPGWFRKAATAALVAGAMGGIGLALAAPKHTFTAQTLLTASDLNDNFNDLDARLRALEASDAGSPRLVITRNGKQYSLGATYCGATAAQTGLIAGGYAGAKSQCQQVASCGSSLSAHMCTADEMVASAQLGLAPPIGWFSYGIHAASSGYAINDCSGWSNPNSTEYGGGWDTTGSGRPSSSLCNNVRPVLCCD